MCIHITLYLSLNLCQLISTYAQVGKYAYGKVHIEESGNFKGSNLNQYFDYKEMQPLK